MEILNEFGIKPILLAAQVVNFLILLFILKKFLYGPILKVLKERKNKIAQSLKNAEEIEKRLEEISEKEQKMMMKAASDIDQMIKQGQDSAAAIIEEGKVKAQEVADKIVADTQIAMLHEKKKLEGDIKGNFVQLFSLGFEKIWGKPLSKEQKESLEKTVKELK